MSALRACRAVFTCNYFVTPFRTLRPAFQRPSPLRPQTQIRSYQYQRFGGQGYGQSRFQQTVNAFQRWSARPTFYYEVAGVGTVVGGFYMYNLETVPVSGRKRFNVISPETESELAQQEYGLIMQEYRGQILSEWDPRVRMVKRVLDKLIPVSGLVDQRWEVNVIDSPEKNAFVIPGGKVFVFTGILPICRDETGVATVLGHEIAHNVAHHAAERMSSGFLITLAFVILAYTIGLPDYASRLLLELGFRRPGSRKQEAEADFIGLMMMSQACYDPTKAVEFWGRMQRAGEMEPPQFLSTHPSSRNREEKLREWLPEAEDKLQMSDCHSTLGYADDFKKAFSQIRW